MFVIGTAGHVDHGKSTLVKALTGIDPDRLREEKERGMTIDLGFAWLGLPSGREVSIVDVPGHVRFIKNMLAGVASIDLAVLVVAADDAVMPQTREHLAILNILHVKRGLVAITKTDLVDQDWLELVTVEVEEALKSTTLEGALIRPVSSYTGQGLSELVVAIDDLLSVTESRRDTGRPRLSVDRSFGISGFGTVVTGTLTDGSLTVGQGVELIPSGKQVRIRGLQTHRKSEEVALPGIRAAVNLAGISHDEVHRGDVLTMPGWLRPTVAIDVHLRLIPNIPRPLKHNTTVSLHVGTTETLSRVRLLDCDQLQPGENGLAQLRVQEQVAVAKGDFFVIRSSDTTLGGGSVIDPYAKRHRRHHTATLDHLATLLEGTGEEVLLEALDLAGPSRLPSLAQRTNFSLAEARAGVQTLVASGKAIALGDGAVEDGTILLSAQLWTNVVTRGREAMLVYHHKFPVRRGAPREELRNRLGLNSQVSALAIQRLILEAVVVEEDTWIRLPEHRVAVTQQQRKRMEDYLSLLRSEPYSPPTGEPLEQDLLNMLVEEGKVVKVSDNVIFAEEPYRQMVEGIIQNLRLEEKITVAQVRNLFGTSRKYALACLEHMDQRRITRRVGDERVLR